MKNDKIRDEALTRWVAAGGDEGLLWSNWQLVPGPRLDEVTARIAATPAEFLDPAVDITALLHVVAAWPGLPIGGSVERREAAGAALTGLGDEVRAGAAIALWLLGSQESVRPFEGERNSALTVAPQAPALLLGLRLAPVAPPRTWFTDDERREEAARWFLLACGRIPAGENREGARAALDMRDSLRRDRSFTRARAAYEHRAAVAAAMREKAAQEAAARYGHE